MASIPNNSPLDNLEKAGIPATHNRKDPDKTGTHLAPNKVALLQGEINGNITLVDIFQTLVKRGRDGRLAVKDKDIEFSLYLQNRSVGLIFSPFLTFDTLPEKLYYASKISQERYLTICGKDSADTLKIVKQLVPSEFSRLQEIMLYDAICDLLAYPNGLFEFFQEVPPQEAIPKFFDIDSILMEAVRRQDEFASIKKNLPLLSEILIHNADASTPDSKKKDELRGNLWFLADKRSVGAILKFSYFSNFETCKLLVSLIDQKNLRLFSDAELIACAQDAESKNETLFARECYDLLKERSPQQYAICETIVKFYEKIGDLNAAIVVYQNFVGKCQETAAPQDHKELALALKKMCTLQGDSNEALASKLHLFQLMTTEKLVIPNFTYVAKTEGGKLVNQLKAKGLTEKIRQVLETLVNLSPEDWPLRSELIQLNLSHKDISGALYHYDEAVKFLVKCGDKKKLATVYQEILEIAPKRQDIYQQLIALKARKKYTHKIWVSALGGSIAILIVLIFGIQLHWSQQQRKLLLDELKQELLQKNWRRLDDLISSLSWADKERERQEINLILNKLAEEVQQGFLKAQELEKQGSLLLAKQQLEKIVKFSRNTPFYIEIKTKLEMVESLIAEFNAKLTTAKGYEREKKFAKAIENYLSIWNDSQLRKFPEAKAIELPILLNIRPQNCVIIVDGKIASTDSGHEIVLKLAPDFQIMQITLDGYESYSYYNAFFTVAEDVLIDAKGDKVYPLCTHELKLELRKKCLNFFSLAGEARGDICFGNGGLYIVCSDGYLYAFSRQINLKWSLKIGDSVSFAGGPVYSDHFLYIALNNILYAVYIPPDANSTSPYIATQYTMPTNFAAAPLLLAQNRKLVCLGENGKVYCFTLFAKEVKKGLLWQPTWTLNLTTASILAATVLDEMVIVTTKFNQCYIIDTTKETIKSECSLAFSGYSITAIDQILYVGGNKYIAAIKLNTQQEIWRTKIDGMIGGRAVVFDRTLYCLTSAGTLYALSVSNGSNLWKFTTSGAFHASPIASGQIVYAGCEDGHLYAIRQGELLWKYNIEKGHLVAPFLLDNFVFVASKKLYSFFNN